MPKTSSKPGGLAFGRTCGVAFALCMLVVLGACTTPNSSAIEDVEIASVNAEPATPAQEASARAALREILAANGFTAFEEIGPDSAVHVSGRRAWSFRDPDVTRRFHGLVSTLDDDTVRLDIVDNQVGERTGFGADSCKRVVSVREALRRQFGPRLQTPPPDAQARQWTQLRACE